MESPAEQQWPHFGGDNVTLAWAGGPQAATHILPCPAVPFWSLAVAGPVLGSATRMRKAHWRLTWWLWLCVRRSEPWAHVPTTFSAWAKASSRHFLENTGPRLPIND